MRKEIYKYPYNVRIEDEIKVFLSDQIGEQVIKITYRNGQIFCTIKDKITSKKKEIILSAAVIFGALFGMPREARPIGVSPRLPSAPEISRPAPQYFYQHAPTINPRVDKIIMITNNKMIPLIYINGHYSYINEQLLKKLRAGDLAANITVVAIGVVVYVMCNLSGVDAFTILQQIGKWNAPTVDHGFGLNPYKTSSSQTDLQMEKPSAMPQQNYSSLTKSERRQLADPLGRDSFIEVDGFPRLDIRFNQVEFKTPKHGKHHSLPVGPNGKTPKTEANAIALRDSLINMANKQNIIWYTDGQYQGGTKRGCDCVNLFDPDTNLIAVYQKQPDGSHLFLTTCKLTEIEADNLKATNGNFVTETILEQQNSVSTFEIDDMGITPISPMGENSSPNPSFTPTNSFESDVMGITPINNRQSNNP